MNKIFLIQPSRLIKKFYSSAVWNFKTKEKVIYLTFDDGPVPVLTEWVLDELKKHNAKATFFCVGDNIVKHRAIFDRIRSEGHVTANHTQNHLKGFHSSIEDYLESVDKCEVETQSKIFRPPYGQLRKSQFRSLQSMGYKIVFWDVISYDYEKITPEECYQNVKKHTKAGSIVLFHDNMKAEKNVKHALSKTLEHFTSLGYVFKSLTFN